MTTERIKIDFLGDVIAGMSAQLAAWGHSIPSDADRQTIATLFTNLERRRIEPRPRVVHMAGDLVCPEVHRDGYDLVTRKLTSGDDVNAHLSRTVQGNADYDDMLLNDWGFHHLHLGTAVMPNGLMQRTGALLFVYVQTEGIYFVGIGNHHDWAAKRLNDTLFNNWPELFEGRTMPLYRGKETWSQEEHGALRKAGVFALTTLPDGRVVFPLGGGFATSRRSVDVTTRVARIFEMTSELERRLATMAPTIVARLTTAGVDVAALDLHLRQTADGVVLAVDEQLKVQVVLFEPTGRS
jgi:hypothetical protein